MRRAPWDFTCDDPTAPLVPNLPSAEGALAGKELARLARPEFAKPGAPVPCNECAFVEGTRPNRSAATILDVVKCLVEDVPFYCHKGLTATDERGLIIQTPKRLCAGWEACSESMLAKKP